MSTGVWRVKDSNGTPVFTKDGREVWAWSFCYQGRQVQRRVRSEALAHARRLEAIKRMDQGLLPEKSKIAKPDSVAKCVTKYLAEGCETADTRAGYASLASRLVASIGDVPITHVNEVTIRKLRETLRKEGDGRKGKRHGKKITEDRITKHVTLLRAAMRFGKCSEFFDRLSKKDRRRVFAIEEDPTHVFRRFSDEEFEKIVAQLPEPYRVPARLALLTGMRQSEVFGLQEEEIRGNEIHLPGSRTKNGKPRTVILNSKAVALLSLPRVRSDRGLVFTGPRGGAVTFDASERWRLAARAAGLPHIWFHDLRHEFASRFVEKGGTLIELMEAGGWSSLAMVQRYAKASRDRIRAVQEKRYEPIEFSLSRTERGA